MMSTIGAKSGFPFLAELPWGTHFCQFCEQSDDFVDVLVRYFKAGLESNEGCVWLTSGACSVDEAKDALRSAVGNLDARLERGQIEIVDCRDWYMSRNGNGSRFDADAVIARWIAREELALSRGFAGVRVTGDTYWLECRQDFKSFAEYEERLSAALKGHRVICLCHYWLDRSQATDVLDAVRSHEFTVARRRGSWEIVEAASLATAKEELRAREERLRLAVEAGEVGTFGYFPKTSTMIWDDRVKVLWGVGLDAESDYDIWLSGVHPEDRQRVEAAFMQMLQAEGPREFDIEHRLTGLEQRLERWVAAKGKMILDDAGEPVRCVGVVRDISERHHAEEWRERLTGIFAHDLRSPLSAILMASEALLVRNTPPEENLNTIRLIAGSANRMTRMVQQLMDLARVRFGGGITLELERVDLAAVCREAGREVEMANPGRSVRYHGPPACVGQWDRISLGRVLSNLLNNAVHHGRGESAIEIGLRDEGAEVALEVQNGGAPIPPDLLPVIFDPFRRGKSGQRDSTGGQGLGLGLYIVREIVAAHGGTVGVHSTAEDGTTLTVRLPRRAVPSLV